jgi:transglutaminase-like putative cysteine protease
VHAHHLAYLRPRELQHQKLARCRIQVEPAPLGVNTIKDYFGNLADEIEILSSHDVFEVSAESEVVVERAEPDVALLPAAPWEQAVRRLRGDPDLLAAREFCFDSPLVRLSPALASYASAAFAPGRPLPLALDALCRQINTEFVYDPSVTDISTPLSRVLRDKRGVCQDFAQLAVGCLRSLGLSARYVSGYLETQPPPGKPRLIGADASHAWASCFVPDHGWLDLDPTNAVLPSERHVTLAVGRDFSDASPLRGVVLGGGSQRLSVSVTVEPVAAA